MELNKIYNENCLNTMDRMPDNFIDLVVTSPPYDTIRNYEGYSFNFDEIAKELFRVVKIGGVVVWVVADKIINGSQTGTSFKQALFFKELGFLLHDTMIYKKRNPAPRPSNVRYVPSFEYMFILSKIQKPKTINLIKDVPRIHYVNNKTVGVRDKNGKLTYKRYSTKGNYKLRNNVWEYKTGLYHSAKERYIFEHPAVFPEKLAYDHILSWSNENDIVYDPFMGSGTTAKAAVITKRNYIGSEIAKKYIQIANKRLKKLENTLF